MAQAIPTTRQLGESLVEVLADLLERSATDGAAYRLYDAILKQYCPRTFDRTKLVNTVKAYSGRQAPQPTATVAPDGTNFDRSDH